MAAANKGPQPESFTVLAIRDALDRLDERTTPEGRLREAAQLLREVEGLMRETVSDARMAGASWMDIARWVGLKSKQTAWAKYGNSK